ncbi:MAG: hypothetical protein QM754_04835 [Tepidisphaeraceae bacterium]
MRQSLIEKFVQGLGIAVGGAVLAIFWWTIKYTGKSVKEVAKSSRRRKKLRAYGYHFFACYGILMPLINVLPAKLSSNRTSLHDVIMFSLCVLLVVETVAVLAMTERFRHLRLLRVQNRRFVRAMIASTKKFNASLEQVKADVSVVNMAGLTLSLAEHLSANMDAVYDRFRYARPYFFYYKSTYIYLMLAIISWSAALYLVLHSK